LDIEPNRRGFFFFESSEFKSVVKSVQDFWSTFEGQLKRIPKSSKKPKATAAFDSFGNIQKRIRRHRYNLTTFLESHLGGADECYRYSRQTILIKLVTFVDKEIQRIKDGRNSSKV